MVMMTHLAGVCSATMVEVLANEGQPVLERLSMSGLVEFVLLLLFAWGVSPLLFPLAVVAPLGFISVWSDATANATAGSTPSDSTPITVERLVLLFVIFMISAVALGPQRVEVSMEQDRCSAQKKESTIFPGAQGDDGEDDGRDDRGDSRSSSGHRRFRGSGATCSGATSHRGTRR